MEPNSVRKAEPSVLWSGGVWKERLDAVAVVMCRVFGYGGLVMWGAFSSYDRPIEQLLGQGVAVLLIINANLIRLRMER